MKIRFISAIIAVVMIFVSIPIVSAAGKSVQQTVYDYLTSELSLCPAAAAGIMGNIMIECSFDPSVEAMDTNGLYSFGLMMWNGPRYERLKKWCSDHGYKKEDPLGQLGYLKWELENTETGAYKTMKNIPNTIEGAAKAAILWASEFERCTKTSYGLRIYYTLNNYWQKFAGGTVSNTPGIYGYYYNVPDNIKYGEPLTMYGAVVSYSSNLKSLTVGVYDTSGNLVTGKSLSQSELVGNIGVIDRFIVFNKIPRGSYYYTITAVNESGDYIVDRHAFTVSDKATTSSLIPESRGGVICELGASCPGLAFRDMPPATNWSHSYLDRMLNTGLIRGVSKNTVEPDGDMTRAMLVTVLRRVADKYSLTVPEVSRDGGFNDVPAGKWYTDDVMWAYTADLIDGTAPGIFEPDRSITRAEITTLIYRFADACILDVTNRQKLDGFKDADDVEDWAYEAVSWAVARGIIAGSSDSSGQLSIEPDRSATRAEVSAMLLRFLG